MKNPSVSRQKLKGRRQNEQTTGQFRVLPSAFYLQVGTFSAICWSFGADRRPSKVFVLRPARSRPLSGRITNHVSREGRRMIVTGKALPRRTFLKGVGAAVALPFLDSMVPAFAAPAKLPVRLAFLYVPNGIEMKNWNVPQAGPLAGNLPRIMKPLEEFCGDMIQIGNLTNNSGRALLDGAGDHGRCAGSYLTGVQVKKTTIDIKASVSCDQIIANKIGHETRFASLELGMDDSRQAGDYDSGYSCAYTNKQIGKAACR